MEAAFLPDFQKIDRMLCCPVQFLHLAPQDTISKIIGVIAPVFLLHFLRNQVLYDVITKKKRSGNSGYHIPGFNR